MHAEKLSAVGELASGVAHEINNPLTTILGQAHLLLDHSDVTPHVRDRVKIIADEASRAARIVQNLLLFARHYPPERRPCSLADQVRRVIELIGYQLELDQIRIEMDVVSSPPVWADENQIQQVVLNLVQNAHQAMVKQDGERVVTMRIRAVGATVLLEVLDTGPGIEPEALSRLFDPFFTTKPPGEGSGLGLSVSYGIVTEHKGRLRGENRTDRARRDLHRRAAGGRGGLSVRPLGGRGRQLAGLALLAAFLGMGCTRGVGGPVPGAPGPSPRARLRQRQSRLRPAALLDAHHVLRAAHVGGHLFSPAHRAAARRQRRRRRCARTRASPRSRGSATRRY